MARQGNVNNRNRGRDAAIQKGDLVLNMFERFPAKRRCQDPAGVAVVLLVCAFQAAIFALYFVDDGNSDVRRLGSRDEGAGATVITDAVQPAPAELDVSQHSAPEFESGESSQGSGLIELDAVDAEADAAKVAPASSSAEYVMEKRVVKVQRLRNFLDLIMDPRREVNNEARGMVLLLVSWLFACGGFFITSLSMAALICCITAAKNPKFKMIRLFLVFLAGIFAVFGLLCLDGEDTMDEAMVVFAALPIVGVLFYLTIYMWLPPLKITQKLLVNFKVYANGKEEAVSVDLLDGVSVAGVVGFTAAKSLSAVLAAPLEREPFMGGGGRSLAEAGALQPTLMFLLASFFCCVFDALLAYNIIHGANINMLGRKYLRESPKPTLASGVKVMLTTSLGSASLATLAQMSSLPALVISQFIARIRGQVHRPMEFLGTNVEYHGDWALSQCAIRGVSFLDGARAAECLHNRRWVKMIDLSLPVSSFTMLSAMFFAVLGCVAGAVAGGFLDGRAMSAFFAFAGTWIFAVGAACMCAVIASSSRALVSLWAENPKLVSERQPMVEQALRQLIDFKMTSTAGKPAQKQAAGHGQSVELSQLQVQH